MADFSLPSQDEFDKRFPTDVNSESQGFSLPSQDEFDNRYSKSNKKKPDINYEEESKKFKNEFPSMYSPSSALQFGGVENIKHHPVTTQLAMTAPLMGISAGAGLLNSLGRTAIQGSAGTGFSELDPNNKNSLLENAGMNFGGNALLEGGGALLGKGLQAGKNYIKSLAAPSFAKGVGDIVSDKNAVMSAPNALPEVAQKTAGEHAFDKAKAVHDTAAADENNKWNVAKGYASIADTTPGINYNNEGYMNGLEKMRQELTDKLKVNPSSDKHIASLQFVHNLLDAAPSSFEGALKHHQGLNEYYRDSIGGAKLPTDVVSRAIKLSKGDVAKNLENNNLSDTVKSTFDNANSATQAKNQTFHQVVTPKGKNATSTFSNLIKNNNPNFDKASFIKDYVPKGGEDIGKMQQFSKMVGDEDFGKKTLRSHYFDNSAEPKEFLKKYNNLSQKQREYLFSNAERSKVDSLNKILRDSPNALKSNIAKGFGRNLVTGLIGTGTAIATHGMSLVPNAITGGLSFLGGNAIRPIGNAIAQTKFGQKALTNALTNPKRLGLSDKIRGTLNPFAGPVAEGMYNSEQGKQ